MQICRNIQKMGTTIFQEFLTFQHIFPELDKLLASLVKGRFWKRQAQNGWVDLKGDSLNLIHVVNTIYDYVFMYAMLLGHHEN